MMDRKGRNDADTINDNDSGTVSVRMLLQISRRPVIRD